MDGVSYTTPFSLTGWPSAIVRAGTAGAALPLGVWRPPAPLLGLQHVLRPREPCQQRPRAVVRAAGCRRVAQPMTQPKDAAPCGHHGVPSGRRSEPEPEVKRLEVIGELDLEGISAAQKLDAPNAFVRGRGE